MNIVPVRVTKGLYLLVAFTSSTIMVEARTVPARWEGGYASYPVKYATYKQALLACELAKGDRHVFDEAVVCEDRAEFDARLAMYRIAVR